MYDMRDKKRGQEVEGGFVGGKETKLEVGGR